MRRWPAWSISGFDAWIGVVLFPVAVVVGLGSEGVRFGWEDFSRWVPDLVVGLVFVGCGMLAVPRVRGTAVLLQAAGFAWFVGNFWSDAVFFHRGLLVHLLVAYPGWKPRQRFGVVVVTIGYSSAMFVPAWRTEPAAIILAGMVVAVVVRGFVTSTGRLRRARLPALVAAVIFSASVVVGALTRLTVSNVDFTTVVRLLYEVALCCVALVLAAALPASGGLSVLDLVVELGETRSGTLRDALAATLADPSLEIGFWDRRARYLDAEGHPVAIPPPGAIRSVTYVEHGLEPFAVLVHDGSILGERALVEAVAGATRLSTVNAELQTVVHIQLAELSASRRRLVSAADEARRRLDDQLRSGAERHLRELDELLRRATCDGRPETVRTERAKQLVAQTIEDLRELATGLHPRDLDVGLTSALEKLAARSAVPVALVVDGEPLATETGTAIFYVCAEMLANTMKHAAAGSVTIRVIATGDRVLVAVTDDGVGGADVGRGSGLRGLFDRIEALEGTLRLTSPAGGGTALVVEIPNQPAVH